MNYEKERIQEVYAARDKKKELYAWHRPEIRYQEGEKNAVIASLLAKTHGTDLSKAHVLDVGCGTGGFLRTLIEWGAQPSYLLGTELLIDRLEIARNRSNFGVRYHLGDLSGIAADSFDLVTAHTVFSSILDNDSRRALANQMWRVLKPGGCVLIYDFRYNNPSNSNVRRVSRADLFDFWKGGSVSHYQTLTLAPPIARKVIPIAPLLGKILTVVLPFLRSHFCFLIKKPPRD